MRTCLVLLSIVVSALAGDPELIPGVGVYWVATEPSGVNSEFRWNEAMSTCQYQGGHLVVINSQAEADAVAKIMKKHGIDGYVHIGMSDLITEGHFLTLEDENLKEAGYSAWANGYPNGGRTSNCGAMNTRGQLIDISCYNILPVICEANMWDTYSRVNTLGYYKVYAEAMTWDDAMVRCQQEGANLAVINSAEEAKVVVDLLLHSRSPLAFVGIHDAYIEGVFFTIDGKKVEDSGYVKWAENEPSVDTERNVVAIDALKGYRTMENTAKLPFVCERSLYKH